MISIIAAIGKNNELGKDNNLIWHIKGDLAHFKELTMHKKIVMGASTYKSLPKKLEGREYIILSKSLSNIPDAVVYQSFDDLLAYLNTLDEEVMIIGGASIYKLFLPYAEVLYLTEIEEESNADVYFPEFDKKDFTKTLSEEHVDDDIKYKFVTYVRLK
ncbi:MAG TPA: dihydrofolate reductase [Candidatus Onthocola stercorigallinarum]|nr:dihydrofolate reductase [Candidatus Onthocola stercorigallinarum]